VFGKGRRGGLPVNQQNLNFSNGQYLKDTDTLRDVGVETGMVLRLEMKGSSGFSICTDEFHTHTIVIAQHLHQSERHKSSLPTSLSQKIKNDKLQKLDVVLPKSHGAYKKSASSIRGMHNSCCVVN